MKRSLIFILFLLVIVSSCRKKHWNCDSEVSYKNDVKPLFEAHCNKCHSYDSYAKVQGIANNGQLKEVTITTSKMPAEGEKPLTLKERKLIFCWIEAGAKDN